MRFYVRALSYFRADAGKLVLLGAILLTQVLVGLLQAGPLAVMVDTILSPTPKSDWIHRLFLWPLPEGHLGRIAGLAAATLVLRLVLELLNMARTMLNHRIGYAGLLRVRCELFKKLQTLSAAFHNSLPQGDAIQRLSDDAGGFNALLTAFLSVTVSAASLAVMAVIMFTLDVKLTLIALAVAPLLFLTNVHFGRVFKARCDVAKESQSEFLVGVQRAMATMGLIQAYGRERDEYHAFADRADSSIRAWLSLHRDEVLYMLTVGTIFAVGGASIFGYGGLMVYRSEILHQSDGMSVGGLTIFLAYLGMLYDPLCKLSGAASSVQSGASGARRVFEVLDRPVVIADAPGAIALPVVPRTLRLADVGFSYQPGRPVFEHATCTIEPGEMVAFVGASGVGKSTMLNLLPRFYDPTHGAITLDGHDLRALRLCDIRKHVAVVLQESMLLPTTVAENIAYGRPGATPAAIRRAADLAGADFIDELPRGFDTRLDEAGQRLSGGQRQRICIARALLTEAPILVLDEPTSALDPEHERHIVETLDRLRGRRTIVLISHRLHTVAASDRIFVMDKGRIAERGKHAELLAEGGLYHRLWHLEIGCEARADRSGVLARHDLSIPGAEAVGS
jgi:ABC-type multidrug transport system fused ATPase/permease subunit